MQRQVARGAGAKDILPKVLDLPEFLSEAEFKRRFGEVDGLEHRKMSEIERRIGTLPRYW